MMSNMSSGSTIETKLILGHSGAASIRTPCIVIQPEIETELSEGIPEIELLSSSSELTVELCDEYGRWPNSRRKNDLAGLISSFKSFWDQVLILSSLTTNVGQLAAQVNATHCMIDYIKSSASEKIMNTRVALFHLPQCQDHVVMDV